MPRLAPSHLKWNKSLLILTTHLKTDDTMIYKPQKLIKFSVQNSLIFRHLDSGMISSFGCTFSNLNGVST